MTPEERAEYRRMAELVKAHGRETATTVITCGDLLELLDCADRLEGRPFAAARCRGAALDDRRRNEADLVRCTHEVGHRGGCRSDGAWDGTDEHGHWRGE